jgi:hypothetical protein
MKQVFLLVGLLVLFVGCKQPEKNYFSESPEIESSKQLLGHLASYDAEAIAKIYSDSAKIYDNSLKAASPSEMIANMAQNKETMDYLRVRDSADYEMVITKEGETWVNCWYVMEGKFKGSETVLTVPCHSTFQFVDGKIVKDYSYYNMSDIIAEYEKIEAMAKADTLTEIVTE